jgi:phosphoglycerol transferase MdoB-like AlkP superfamily enzyme
MSPDAWLATNWAPLRDGDQKDVAPTILTLFGIDPAQYAPRLPGRSLWATPR